MTGSKLTGISASVRWCRVLASAAPNSRRFLTPGVQYKSARVGTMRLPAVEKCEAQIFLQSLRRWPRRVRHVQFAAAFGVAAWRASTSKPAMFTNAVMVLQSIVRKLTSLSILMRSIRGLVRVNCSGSKMEHTSAKLPALRQSNRRTVASRQVLARSRAIRRVRIFESPRGVGELPAQKNEPAPGANPLILPPLPMLLEKPMCPCHAAAIPNAQSWRLLS